MEYIEDATGSTDLVKNIVCHWGKSEISLPFLCSPYGNIYVEYIICSLLLLSIKKICNDVSELIIIFVIIDIPAPNLFMPSVSLNPIKKGLPEKQQSHKLK